MVCLRQGRAEAEWDLLLDRHGTVVRVGEESTARRSEPLYLLSRYGAGSENGQILGQFILSARARERHSGRAGTRGSTPESMAVLGIHDSSKYSRGQGGR